MSDFRNATLATVKALIAKLPCREGINVWSSQNTVKKLKGKYVEIWAGGNAPLYQGCYQFAADEIQKQIALYQLWNSPEKKESFLVASKIATEEMEKHFAKYTPQQQSELYFVRGTETIIGVSNEKSYAIWLMEEEKTLPIEKVLVETESGQWIVKDSKVYTEQNTMQRTTIESMSSISIRLQGDYSSLAPFLGDIYELGRNRIVNENGHFWIAELGHNNRECLLFTYVSRDANNCKRIQNFHYDDHEQWFYEGQWIIDINLTARPPWECSPYPS